MELDEFYVVIGYYLEEFESFCGDIGVEKYVLDFILRVVLEFGVDDDEDLNVKVGEYFGLFFDYFYVNVYKDRILVECSLY